MEFVEVLAANDVNIITDVNRIIFAADDYTQAYLVPLASQKHVLVSLCFLLHT